MATFLYNQQPIHYANEGDGPALLLIHGLGGNANNWLYQRNYFKKQFQVITVDLPGHGKSGGKTEIPFQEYHQVVYKLVTEELNLSSFMACGISMGGKVAMNLGYYYKDQVKGLILADTFARIDEETGAKRKALFSLLEEEDGVDRWITGVIQEMGIRPDSTVGRSFHQGMKANDTSFINRLFVESQKQDQVELLPGISAPALIIEGERDRFIPQDAAQTMLDGLEDAQLYIVPDSGHLPHVEQPQIFNEKVGEFLAQIVQKR